MDQYNENLLGYLCMVDDQFMIDRIGEEKLIDFSPPFATTQGQYGNAFRLLYFESPYLSSDTIFGCVHVVLNKHKIIIANMIVAPGQRRRKIGSMLITELRRRVKDYKGHEIVVSNIASESGVEFFKAQGIEEI